MQYKVEKIYRRNIGGTCLVEVPDEDTIPDKCYDGCIFYKLIGEDGCTYFGKNRMDVEIEAGEIHLLGRAEKINHVIELKAYDVRYGIIMRWLEGYEVMSLSGIKSAGNMKWFKSEFKNVYEGLELRGILDEIDLHPANVMIKVEDHKIKDFMIIDLEPIGCNRSAYTLKKIMAL